MSVCVLKTVKQCVSLLLTSSSGLELLRCSDEFLFSERLLTPTTHTPAFSINTCIHLTTDSCLDGVYLLLGTYVTKCRYTCESNPFLNILHTINKSFNKIKIKLFAHKTKSSALKFTFFAYMTKYFVVQFPS